MNIDFSFNNDLIRAYFEGSNDYVPSSELIYLHEHPLIKGSFLTEIERMINETSSLLHRKNMQGPIVQRFIEYSIRLGAELPIIDEQTAPRILEELRNIYSLCNGLLD